MLRYACRCTNGTRTCVIVSLPPQGVTERFVATPEEVLQAIEEGKSNRHTSVTS